MTDSADSEDLYRVVLRGRAGGVVASSPRTRDEATNGTAFVLDTFAADLASGDMTIEVVSDRAYRAEQAGGGA
jgi:hypothetical protein